MTVATAAKVRVFQDCHALMMATAEHILELARSACQLRGTFTWVLAGGATPRSLYELVANSPAALSIDWQRVHFFWGDERCVPPEHTLSNYRMARETLLDGVSPAADHVHRMLGEAEPEAAARAYEDALRRHFGPNQLPHFDLVLLGMGEDGHTASLFPFSAALAESQRWVVPNCIARDPVARLTLTPTAINQARQALFLVAGAEKAERLRQVLRGPRDPERLPAQLIQPAGGTLCWFVDADAARKLDGNW